MRKWLSLCGAALVLLSVAACSSPFSLEPETEPPSAERTFVITSQVRQGVDAMKDCVVWQNNAFCAVQYIGTRSNYTAQLKKIFDAQYPQMEAGALDAMQRVDVGGDDVLLVVPRFDLETLSVFSVAIDSAGKTHILKQVTETEEAFLLFCNTGDDPNAALTIDLAGMSQQKKSRIVLKRNGTTGEFDLPNGIQILS